MDESFLENVINLHRENQWKQILALNENSSSKSAERLLWVWPSESNLKFIKEVLLNLQATGITSVGCGCGLLEWIIEKSLGIPVIGLEVNQEWWKSKYSPPAFINLHYPSFPLKQGTINNNHALLFCYFNDGQAFRDYVQIYNGNLIFIIGPAKCNGRHTDPLPLNPKFDENNQWKLNTFQEIKSTGDVIAAYVRH